MKTFSRDIVKEISALRNEPEWLLAWRLTAFDVWTKMKEPHWAEIKYDPIDYDSLNYYNKPEPIDNSDLKSVYENMGLPESEQKALMGMATDIVIDSRSVHTSYTDELSRLGIIFLPFSEAVEKYPDLVKKHLGTVVPAADNFYAALNAAVFSDGTFVYVPKNTKCPIDLASYFRIETAKIGQFERTLIVADEGAELSYLEGCSAPRRPNHQLHSGVVEVIAFDNAIVKYATVQNWYAGDYKENKKQTGGILNFVTKRGKCYKNARLDWTQVEIGSAMTWKYPSTILMGDDASSDFYSLTITRGLQQADTGTKMIHLGNNTKSNIVSYGVALEESVQTFRSLVHFSGTGGKNACKCDSRIIGDTAVANTIPRIVHNNGENEQSHEATTGAIDAAALLYLKQSGIEEDEATALIISGLASPIIGRLPMEFLVESKQLIKMALSKE
ncbi:MAG: Fe-S cluster assembly protein SufB [Alphaproteobacteria bacterium]|nr:Fe-S cluster assembly protein SufB [Alphaproteobacteria bacterium]MBN2675172.1 Fe-S cluster assembly protein SufB [Alphaproteobacteria bacterium]